MAKMPRKAVGSLVGWVVDFAIDHWPQITVTIVGGGGMTYLAIISDWEAKYGPIALGAACLFSMLAFSMLYFFYYAGLSKKVLAQYTGKKLDIDKINVLAAVHDHERIDVSDFYHPQFQEVTNQRFEACDLMGPAVIVFKGGTLNNCGFFQCEVVLVRPDHPILGVTVFTQCQAINCRLYRLTLLMDAAQYKAFPADIRAGLPVISDGTAGHV